MSILGPRPHLSGGRAPIAQHQDFYGARSEAKRTVALVLGEVEAGLKKSKKEGRYTIGNFGTFTITKRRARKGRNPQTGEAIRIKASKVLKFRPAAALKRAAGA